MPVARRGAAPAASFVGFGSLGAYAGGFTLPEGAYAMEFDVVMHQGTDQAGNAKGPARLGVMINAYPLAGGDALQQFMSMGSKAAESFQPDAETGKKIVAVPGGPSSNFNNKTNWYLFLQSLYNCGMPDGVLVDDFSTIDGIHVRTQNIPEPEDRKGFGSSTGEVGQPERKAGLVPIVSEILDDGKPWEGTGGIPEVGAVQPKPAAAPAKRPSAPSPAARRTAAAPPPPAAAEGDEDLRTAAINGVSEVIEKNPNGCKKLMLRTGTFKAVSAANDGDTAQSVLDTFFSSDAALNGILGDLGFQVVGADIKPA